MSIADSDVEVVVVGLRVYWRTHDEFGPIPKAAQCWWFTLFDAFGCSSSMPVEDWLTAECDNLAEVAVELARISDVTIDVDQVKLDTVNLTAEWQQGT